MKKVEKQRVHKLKILLKSPSSYWRESNKPSPYLKIKEL